MAVETIKAGMPEQRYTISELIEIAEQQTAEGRRALQANEPDAAYGVQQWSDTLRHCKFMKERGVPDSLRNIRKP
jgi:hypothetical protein